MKIRLTHVEPTGVSRVWDIILMDDRQNARVFLNPDGTDFIDLVILESDRYEQVRIPKPSLRHSELPKMELLTPEDNNLSIPDEPVFMAKDIVNSIISDDDLSKLINASPTGHMMPF